jgi:hypothetical protein
MCGNLFPLMNYEISASRLETTNSFYFILLKATNIPKYFRKENTKQKSLYNFIKECK